MTVERLTDQQIEEEARMLQRMLCNNPGVREQLEAMVRLGRGGIIKLVYKTNNQLQKVGFENQVQAG